jgi:hypothetical protein
MAYFVMKYKVYPLPLPYTLTSPSRHLVPFPLSFIRPFYSDSLFEHHKRNYKATHLFDFRVLLPAVQIDAAKRELTTTRTQKSAAISTERNSATSDISS